MNINNYTIYVLNPNIKHCTVCRSPSHDFKSCSTNTGNLTNNKNKNNVNRLTVNQFNQKFKSLIQNTYRPNNGNTKQGPSNFKTKRSPKSITSQTPKSNNITNDNTLINRLLQENAELKQLLRQSIEKIDALQQLKQDVTEIKKNTIDNKEKIGQLNTKTDIIISRTEEFNQNIISINRPTQNTNTYKRKKETNRLSNTNTKVGLRK
ncbi:hypothetical protein C1645_736949 [Glomus cerebriforme]|uniref:Uncharacterized protein n=1 Tax=Glomus cerebriforme TaxID=658196 RepID=A0A397T2T1_9GLOM|nr:hypothetical protein C1645_736949 [Glomus cerebriforme]